MGAAISACACGDDTTAGSNPIASLASRCTNPPKSSVYDEDDDGTRLLGESITLDDADTGSIVCAEKSKAAQQCRSAGFGISCSDGNACSDIEQGLRDEGKSSSAATRLQQITSGAEASNGNRSSSSGRGRASDFDLTKPHPLDPPFLGSENVLIPSASGSPNPSPIRVQDEKRTSLFDTDDIAHAKAFTHSRVSAFDAHLHHSVIG